MENMAIPDDFYILPFSYCICHKSCVIVNDKGYNEFSLSSITDVNLIILRFKCVCYYFWLKYLFRMAERGVKGRHAMSPV